MQVTPCADDADLWHSRSQSDIEAASDACLTCHALDVCGRYADAAGETAGVWTGVSRNPGSNRSARGAGRVESLQRKRSIHSPGYGISTHRPPTPSRAREEPLMTDLQASIRATTDAMGWLTLAAPVFEPPQPQVSDTVRVAKLTPRLVSSDCEKTAVAAPNTADNPYGPS